MRFMGELSSEELAERSGVTAEQLRRLVELGIITPTPQGRFGPSDVQRIRVLDTLADAGFAPEQLSELIATLEQTAAAGLPEDLTARLFESQVRLFHTYVEERLRAEGHADHSWSDDLDQVAASMMASLDRTLVLLYRRHFEHHVLDVTVLRAEAALERAGLARRRPVRPPAIAFLDLTGYTKLSEERGDRAAAELAGRLVQIVHDLAHRRGGRPVKLLGDGVMFHFPEPAQAVRCGLGWSIVSRGSACRGRGSACTAARAVVFQNGDYCGTATTAAGRSTSRPGSATTPDRGRSSSATRSSLTPTAWRGSASSPSGPSRSRG
jgi:adenylate cyclase